MQMIYDSPNFCVLEFSGFEPTAAQATGGFEIMDKTMRREIFLAGADAERFRAGVRQLVADGEPDADAVDAFLTGYRGLMATPIALH